MEYVSSDPSVVRSIRQRVLLNAWVHALRKSSPLPALSDFEPDTGIEELADMMGFDVEGDEASARFVITQEGTRLAATYGNEDVAPEKRTNRYLHDAIGPDRYARVVTCYRECVIRKRPTYSITAVQDADGKDVSYERLLMPFGRGSTVEHIIGSYKAISIEGGFRVNNLLGLRSMAESARIVNAIVDREIARRPAGVRTSDDIVIVDVG
ncbi:MAG TPA: hypothetical protein VID30_05445 [Bradyrhizobium sp.]|jgi:hypothetical protein